VVLDLNHDGQISYDNVRMDINSDGHLDHTTWVGAQDGVLVWDKYADGTVHDSSQYALSQYGPTGSTDLQGLAAGFDSNHDGVFNAQDAQFAQFKVWQDSNQNGVADPGELHSLAKIGITAINLQSDGLQRTPAAGVTEVGHTSATINDGTHNETTMLVADAVFAFSNLDCSMQGKAQDKAQGNVQENMQDNAQDNMQANALYVLGANMQLDLSRLSAVDLTARKPHNVQLHWNDVLSTPAPQELPQLLPLGDAADAGHVGNAGHADNAIPINASIWTDPAGALTPADPTYALYHHSADPSAQLMIDQCSLPAWQLGY
jgi:hypothetical protein